MKIYQKIMLVLLYLRAESHAPKEPSIEFFHYQHRAIIKAALSVYLMTDIHADAAPPYFTLVEGRKMCVFLYVLLDFIPALKIFYVHVVFW